MRKHEESSRSNSTVLESSSFQVLWWYSVMAFPVVVAGVLVAEQAVLDLGGDARG